MPHDEPRAGCGAAIIADGRVLLVKRATEPEAGLWGLPGGKIDMFETAIDATQREIREELGIDIVARELLCIVEQIDEAAKTHWIAPVYLVPSFVGTPSIREPDKHAGLGWFAMDEVPDELTYATVAALGAWRSRQTDNS